MRRSAFEITCMEVCLSSTSVRSMERNSLIPMRSWKDPGLDCAVDLEDDDGMDAASLRTDILQMVLSSASSIALRAILTWMSLVASLILSTLANLTLSDWALRASSASEEDMVEGLGFKKDGRDEG